MKLINQIFFILLFLPIVVLAQSNNEFGINILKELSKDNPHNNIFISPLSISTILALTYNGAAGTTKSAMAKTLKFKSADLKSVNDANLALRNSLQNLSDIKLALANSLWVSKEDTLKTDFLARAQKFYNAKTAAVDFNSAATLTVINDWVKDNTAGKIPHILDALSKDSSLVLVNAIYFKGKWYKPFDKLLTKDKPFYLFNGEKKIVSTMVQSGDFAYLETNTFQAVELTYGKQQNMSMVVFLPKTTSSIDQFMQDFSEQHFAQWLKQFHIEKGSVHLPHFKLMYKTSLANALKKLGMEIAFDSTQADFSNMVLHRKIFIGDVIHQAVMDVSEEGTEAAAATVVTMFGAAVMRNPTKPFSFIVNRPFFCVIVDNQSQVILFMGVVFQPE